MYVRHVFSIDTILKDAEIDKFKKKLMASKSDDPIWIQWLELK